MYPIHLDFDFFSPYFYEGAYFAISIFIAAVWASKRVKNLLNDEKNFEGIITWALISALIGARLSHFLFWEPAVFLSNPAIFFDLSGGNSIVGGLVGGMFGGWLYTRRKKLNYFTYFAAISPAVLLGQALGRLGCFVNGDAYGTNTSLPWGVEFPRYGTNIPSFETNTRVSSEAWRWSFENGLVDANSTASAPLHPTQLYEMFGDLAIMYLVFVLVKKMWGQTKNFKNIFYIHVGGYSFLRFALEFIRADNDSALYLGMTGLQVSLLALSLFMLFLYFKDHNQKKATA